jgi:CheY-like chemotaxis protein
MPMKPILVVDDSPTIRRMVKVALGDVAQGGFTEAGSGHEAIEQLTLNAASLIVLDLNMPDMHGLEAITANPATPPDLLIADIGLPEEDGYVLIERVRSCRRGITQACRRCHRLGRRR